jgi:succinoglycan biosynthesis transport protein ExoP
MDLIYLFKSLLRRKWLIIISTLMAVLAAFLLTLEQEKLYKSVAQIATGFTMSDQVKLKEESFNIYEIDVKFSNVIEALKSPRVLGMTSYNLMLHDLENPDKAFRSPNVEDKKSTILRKLDRPKAIAVLTKKYNEEQLLSSYDPEERKIQELLKLYKYDLETLRYVLYAGRVQRTDFIDIQYRSVNPELSAYIVNQVCTEYLRNYESSRNQQTVQNIETLKKLVDQKRDELDAKITNIKAMGTLDVSVESSSKLEQISNFENRLADEKSLNNSAVLTLQQINLRLADMSKSNSQASSSSSAMNTELTTLRTQMNEAYSDYVNKGGNDATLYSKYQTLKNDYKSKLTAMASAAPTTTTGNTLADLQQKKSDLELQVKSSSQNIDAYEQKIRQLNSSMGAAASRGANNLALQKEVELAQQEYESIKSRYDAAVNNKIAPMDNFHQILFGQPAVEPEPSKRLIIIALAGMAMLVFCCIAIIFLEYVDLSIKTPTQFLRVLELRLLGVVNRINFKQAPLEGIFTDPNLKKHNTATFRELLRKLRFEMENSGKKIFLFTSTKPREGKSTIIKALAYSLSLSRKSILIIDTQFPNNSLTRDFGAQPVLESFSAKVEDFNVDEIRGLTTETQLPGVFVIGCEGGEYTPSEVLKPGNLLEYLKTLTHQYDYILMEGAALNDRADSKELMKYAETVVAVISARSSIKQTDKETIIFLQNLQEKFGGAILNFVEPENIDI